MAYRSSITTRLTHLRKRFHPSFSHIAHQTEDENHQLTRPPTKHFPTSASSGFNTLFRRNNNTAFFAYPLGHLGFGSSSVCNYSSSAASTITDASEKIEFVGGVADVVLTETGGGGVVDLAAQAPAAASEVAIAAADSFYNVAALQYLIDGVHSFTGFNWWASIALTTLLIRGATVPLLINQLKASTKLAALRPQVEEIKQQMENRAMDPNAASEGQRRIKALFKEHGVTPFTPLKGLLIQGPVFISFFLAINNMVEKVPSFKGGGVFWFTDLTTPDSMYILPVLTSLTFLITVEFNMQEGMEGNPAAGTMKKFSRILAFLTIPFTMRFPKAIFCYWITSNFFSLMYGLVIRRPQVRKFLALPELPQAPTTTATTAQQPAFNLLSAFKGLYPDTKEGSPLPSEPPKISDRKISSSSIISQRIRNLEKQVKGKKKNKRR